MTGRSTPRSTFALVPSAAAEQRFRLDRERLANHLIANGVERFGFDSSEDTDFGEAVLERFEDAERAQALLGPPGAQAVLYAIGGDLLIAVVRERDSGAGDSPRRQLATFGFHAAEVACFGDERFEECCAAIEAILRRASDLLPSFAATRRSERNTWLRA